MKTLETPKRETDGAIFSDIPSALEDLKRGRPLLVVDDENRENEGDFVIPAQAATPEIVNLMISRGRGLVCAPISGSIAENLGLGLMVQNNTDLHGTAFTVSVDAMEGTTTGISARDRWVTARVLADPESRAEDLRRPGHLFPLIARDGGVLERQGHTEAAVDLAVLAGFYPAALICEILNEDGTMARLPQLAELSRELGLRLVTIEELRQFRLRRAVV